MDSGLFGHHLENAPGSYPDWDVVPSPMADVQYSRPAQRSPSPPKRPRNAKNLSLSVPAAKNSSICSSAPASPFRSPRFASSNKRPSNLTINIHSLHRHPSTPELHSSIGSPFVASPPPLTSQKFSNLNGVRDSERPKTRLTDPYFENMNYEESIEKEKAYPDGPRLILEPNIWLYAEPDLELAKTYDIVVNVAREVGNPFIIRDTLDRPHSSTNSESDEISPSPFSPSPSTVSNPSPSLPSSLSSANSPQLPVKPLESGVPISYRYNNVEYVHIPWDHNSSLSQDLPGIVDHILERSGEGKKVLVHCQVYSSKMSI
jgi:tyrosine-protein phosphatase MSG5